MDTNTARQLVEEQCEPGGDLHQEFLTAADAMFVSIGTDAPCGCCKMTIEESALCGKENFHEDCDVDNWLDDFGYSNGKSQSDMLLEAVYDRLIEHSRKAQYWANLNAVNGDEWSYLRWNGALLIQVVPSTGQNTSEIDYTLKDVIDSGKFIEKSSELEAREWCEEQDRQTPKKARKKARKKKPEKIMTELEGAPELRSAVRDSTMDLSNTSDSIRSRVRAIKRRSDAIGESIENAKGQLPAIITLTQRQANG